MLIESELMRLAPTEFTACILALMIDPSEYPKFEMREDIGTVH